METYRKNSAVLTETEAQDLLTAQDDFINHPVLGEPSPHLDGHLMKIWNGGSHLAWEWSNENQKVYDRRIAKESADAAELNKLQTDNVYFKDIKIRKWRDTMLKWWIDDTFMSPLKYNLDASQITERSTLHQELSDWPSLTDFDTHKTDTEIDALKPSAPSWII